MGHRIEALRSALRERRARLQDNARARRNRADGTRCFYCGVAFEETGDLSRTIDHRLARSGGGTDGLVNLVFACQACNARKANVSEADFVASAWLRQRIQDVAGGGLLGS